MNKFNAFTTYTGFSVKQIRQQLIFLYINNISYQKIAEITGYAVSTVRNYCKKYYNDYCEICQTLFYIPLTNAGLNFACDELPKGTNQVYLIKFYGLNGMFLFSKIGTATRTTRERARRELRDYSENFSVVGCRVERIIDCGDIPPEGAESEVRAKLIRKYPTQYLKNDRFLNIDIPADDFTKWVTNYLNGED